MGVGKKIKVIFPIVMIIILIVEGCLSKMICQSQQDSKDDNEQDSAGPSSLRQMGVNEHLSKSVLEQEGNHLRKLHPECGSKDVTFSVARFLRYLIPGEQFKMPKIAGQGCRASFNRVIRGWHDLCPRRTNWSLVNGISSLIVMAVLILLIVGSSAVWSTIVYQVISLGRKESFKLNIGSGSKIMMHASKCFSLLKLPNKMLSKSHDWHLKERKNHPWLEDRLKPFGHFTEYMVLNVLERVASFRPLVSVLERYGIWAVFLAEAGFEYPGVGSAVKCQGCGNFVDIKNFNSHSMRANYHKEGCPFAIVENERENEELINTEIISSVSGALAEGERAEVNFCSTNKECVPTRSNDRNSFLGAPSVTMTHEQFNNPGNGDSDNTESKENVATGFGITTVRRENPQAACGTRNKGRFLVSNGSRSRQTVKRWNSQKYSDAATRCQQVNVPGITQQNSSEALSRESQQRSQISLSDVQPPASERQQRGHVFSLPVQWLARKSRGVRFSRHLVSESQQRGQMFSSAVQPLAWESRQRYQISLAAAQSMTENEGDTSQANSQSNPPPGPEMRPYTTGIEYNILSVDPNYLKAFSEFGLVWRICEPDRGAQANSDIPINGKTTTEHRSPDFHHHGPYLPVKIILRRERSAHPMFHVTVPLTMPVSELKRLFEWMLKIPPGRQVWYYKGRQLDNTSTLGSVQFQTGDTIEVKASLFILE